MNVLFVQTALKIDITIVMFHENPTLYHEIHTQHLQSLNFWVGTFGNLIIAYFLYPKMSIEKLIRSGNNRCHRK